MVEGALSTAGRRGEEYVEQNRPGFKAPASPSGIRRSTEFVLHRTRSGHVLKLRNKADHAAAHDGGSGLHGPKGAKYPITGKRGKRLAFIGRGGAMVFRRSVMHPGVKATHFLLKATEHAYDFAGDELRRGMQRVASRH